MLSVKNLTFSFGSRPLFSNVSFELLPYSLIRLSGENGTGKSTLMSLLAGLRSGYQGEISFSNQEDLRKLVAWLPADANALDPKLTAMDNLKYWQSLRGIDFSEEVVKQELARWGLSGEYLTTKLPVGMFSTGMKRRLSIVRLILAKAPLWLLDEPLFGLDDAACKEFKSLLINHITSGNAAIIITHDERLTGGLNVQEVHLKKHGATK